jgi:hypothetical protein
MGLYNRRKLNNLHYQLDSNKGRQHLLLQIQQMSMQHLQELEALLHQVVKATEAMI